MDVEKIVNKKTALGTGIGAIVGFFFGGPVGGAAGAALGGLIANVKAPQRGQMTPKREMAFQTAMASTDPNYIKGVADAFAGEGFDAHAALLRKRSALRSMPPHIQEVRKNAYRQMMASDNPDQIRHVAATFEGEGSTDAAANLMAHADAVTAAHAAGKSTKPLPDDKMLEGFADKLAKALLHFGPHNPNTKSAAANFIRARGMEVTEGTVTATIEATAAELGVDMRAAAPPPQGEEVVADAGGTPTEAPPEALASNERPSGTVASAPAVDAPAQGSAE